MFLMPLYTNVHLAPLSSAKAPAAQYRSAPPARWPNLASGSRGPAVATLQMALAQLGYLPIRYPGRLAGITGANLVHPPQATWHPSWTEPGLPVTYKRLWSRNQFTVATQGAVMQFQAQQGWAVTGVVSAAVWRRLADDVSHHIANTVGFSYVLVRKNLPETLTLWHNGRVVLQSLTNTGIPQAPTPDGTWPVYLRYLSQDMSGVNPFGVPYNDPGVPYVNYFHGGDAVHGFVRSAYGFPQSLGCVELPVPEARAAWSYLDYGTLVTVEN